MNIPITEAEWQSLLSGNEGSNNFVIDVLQGLMNLGEQANQMQQDLNGEE